MPSPALHTLFRKESFSPRSAGPGGFLRLPAEKPLRHACGVPPPLSRGGLGIPESLASSPEAPLLGELSAKQTERLYEGKPDRERKPLPRGEPFHLHDTAPLRWNKWRSSYKLNDTSLNISCSPTWRSSPDWRSTYFASWAQVRHLGEVRFTALVR